MFCKIIFKVFAFKIEFTFLVTICGLLFTLFTGSLNRGCEKTSVLILKKKQSKKTRKIPRNPEAATGDALEKDLVSECRKVHR